MEEVNLLKVFIASPGDIIQERNAVEQIIYKWNIENTDRKKVVLLPIRWENNSIPTYTENMSGQAILNQQIVENSDILIAIFGHKLGSPVDGYESGTVAEIDYFYNKVGDKVGVFFVEKNIEPNLAHEYSRVVEYKQSLEREKKGLYKSYSEEEVRRFLTYKVEEVINDMDALVQAKSDIKAENNSLNLSMIFDPIEFDNDERLFFIFVYEYETTNFPMNNSPVNQVRKWEKERQIRAYLSNRFFDVADKLTDKGILTIKSSEYYADSYYSLNYEIYKQLKKLLFSNEENIENNIERYKLPLFDDGLPF